MRTTAGAALTRRETEALDLRAQGHTLAEIAVVMDVAETTVKTWLHNTHVKLGVRNALGAVWEAMARGIIEPPERR